jgi:hypothetical protein
MRSRELGALLFGLAGLYTLLLALLGVAQLLPQVPHSGVVVSGQLQVQAAFVNSAVSLLLHLVFGFGLYAGRWRLAGRLLGEPDEGVLPRAARAGRAAAAATAEPGAGAVGIAAAAVCAVAILLLARFVTAVSYGVSLLVIRSNAGDLTAWTLGGILVDLLMVAIGLLLLARRDRVAVHLLRPLPPPGSRASRRLAPQPGAPSGAAQSVAPGGAAQSTDPGGAAAAAAGGGTPWQLPALRFTGLALLAWHLPSLASAVSVFVKWQLRPVGFDLRSQALYDIPPAATGVLAGLYLFLLFPSGMSAVWRRLRRGSP